MQNWGSNPWTYQLKAHKNQGSAILWQNFSNKPKDLC